jgi:dipeptidyl aminopeptidase/acylaminoacyl peptidase
MKISILTITMILGLSALGQLSQEKPFDRLDVFALEYASDPQISPDGSRIAYVRNAMDIMKDGKRRAIWTIDADGNNHQKLTSREMNESSPRWSPDGSRIAFISSTDEGSEIYVYWWSTGKLARLSQLESSPSSINWSPDGEYLSFTMKIPESNPVLVSAPKKPKGAEWAKSPRITTSLRHEQDGAGYISPGYRQIFILPAVGGVPRQVTTGEFQVSGNPQWSPDGQSIIFTSNRNEEWEYYIRNSEIYRVDLKTGTVNALTSRNGPDRNPMVSPDGTMIAYTGFDDRVQTYQVSKLYTMSPDGSNKQEVPLTLDRSVSNIQWDAKSSGLYFMYDDLGDTKVGYVKLDGSYNKLIDNVGGTTIGRPYGGGSYSISKNGQIAYTVCSAYRPADVGRYDKSSSRLTTLNESLLGFRKLGQVEEIWYKSSVDNRRIQGWIVKPPNFDSNQKYPLIVENHGGPISNYGARFSPEMQLYASAGYVVFYPNPRGSTSYGEEFGNLLYNNYPGDDYQDVMDGVDVMVEKEYVDPNNLFVTGGSAGGIMTAWIIGKNNRFKAAAVIKPVMNWISKTLVADNYFYYADYRYPGQPWENFDTYWKFSPISLVGNVQTPTMVMVGMADLRTPLSEAKQLYHALKIRKIETVLVEIPDAYHNISNKPSQMITKIDHIITWFDKYLEQ